MYVSDRMRRGTLHKDKFFCSSLVCPLSDYKEPGTFPVYHTQLKLISDLKIVCDSLLITVIQNRALGALDVNFSYLFLFYN